MWNKKLIALVWLVTFLASINYIKAEDLVMLISFTASEPVTAADFIVTVRGGRLDNLECGGLSGFAKLMEEYTDEKKDSVHCVIFNFAGGTKNGEIATAQIGTENSKELKIDVSGKLSTTAGIAPTSLSFQVNGNTVFSLLSKDNRWILLLSLSGVLVLIGVIILYIGRLQKRRLKMKYPQTENLLPEIKSNSTARWFMIGTLTTGIGVAVFLALVFISPFRNQLLSLLYPKPEITVQGLGDINDDLIVDASDLRIFSFNYGKTEIGIDSPRTEQLSDLDQDGDVDVFDLGQLTGVFDTIYTSTPTTLTTTTITIPST